MTDLHPHAPCDSVERAQRDSDQDEAFEDFLADTGRNPVTEPARVEVAHVVNRPARLEDLGAREIVDLIEEAARGVDMAVTALQHYRVERLDQVAHAVVVRGRIRQLANDVERAIL